MDINCIVLAGGKSSRLGYDKVLETVGNRSLLQQIIFRLSSLNRDIIIVTATEQSLAQFIDYPRLRVVADIYPGKASLGGIYTGLAVSDLFYNLVVACDMPFLNLALLGYMIQLSVDFDLVIPRLGDKVEQLHAVYSKNCLAPIELLIKQGNLRVAELLSLVRVRYVEAEEINRFDPEHFSFFNVNTEADLETARGIMRRDLSNDKC